MQQSKHVFTTLDGMRGIAATLIVIRHTGPYFQPLAFPQSHLAVDLFFLLSGAVICHAYQERLDAGLSTGRFMWARVVRIYPLYLFGTILHAILLACIDGGSAGLLQQVALGVFLLPDLATTDIFPLNGPAWSLFMELCINLVFALAYPHLTGRRMKIGILLCAVGLVVVVVIGKRHTLDVGWTAKSMLAGLPRIGFSFFLGVLLYRARHPGTIAKPFASAWFSWLLLLGLAGALTVDPPERVRPYYELTVCFVGFPGLLYLGLGCRPPGRTGRVFHFLGLISYPFYALHSSFGLAGTWVVRTATGQPVEAFAPAIGVPFLLALVASCIVLERYYDGPVRRGLMTFRTVRIHRAR